MFTGHNFVKVVNNEWVFDITEFVGYKVEFDSSGKVTGYKKAFKAECKGNSEISIERYEEIPVKVINQVKSLISVYVDMRAL